MEATQTQQNYKRSFLEATTNSRVRSFIGAFEQFQPDSYFFTPDTLRFFGDTISNYSMPKRPVKVLLNDDVVVFAYALRRKKAVKGGLTSSAYFAVDDLKHLFSVKEEL